MARLPGTDVWYKTYRVRSDARVTYLALPKRPVGGGQEEPDLAARSAEPAPLRVQAGSRESSERKRHARRLGAFAAGRASAAMDPAA